MEEERKCETGGDDFLYVYGVLREGMVGPKMEWPDIDPWFKIGADQL